MKKALSVFLAIFLLVSSAISLISCADTDQNQTASVTGTDSKANFGTNIPTDLNFSDESDNTVYFVLPDSSSVVTRYALRSIDADEASGDAVDAAVFKRNGMIEQMLGVQIKIVQAPLTSNSSRQSLIYTNVITELQAGSDDYDVIVGTALFDPTISTKGVLLNLNTLEQYDADFIDITQPWWSNQYISTMTHNDRMYWVSGNITLSFSANMCGVVVNGDVYEKYLFQNYGSLYDIVRSGNWTIDLMIKMGNDVFQDKGSITDKADDRDLVGIVLDHADADLLAVGCGVEYSKRDADGKITMSLTEGIAQSYAEKFFELRNNRSTLYFGANIPGSKEVFCAGNALFKVITIAFAESYLREMNNFYIIPLPKLNETQTCYRSRVGDWNMLYGIPTSCKNIPMAAATLELMAAASYELVTPVYYDEALKYKYTRDDDTAEMIDLIRDSVYNDFALVYSDYLGELWAFFRNQNAPTTSSQLASNSKVWSKLLTKLLNTLDEADVDS